MEYRENKAADVILTLCREQKITQTELSYRLGEDLRGFSQRMLKTKDMKMSKFIEMLEALGYGVELVETGVIRLKEKVALEVIKEPKKFGYFWYIKDDNENTEQFIAIAKTDTVKTKTFTRREDCIAWLTERKNME